ncbi:MAG: hypothetical protein V3T70_10120, partial [Phycisphaerae bacterium]
EYLWCFDHGNEHGPGFVGVRLSFLWGDIKRLGSDFPPAMKALRKRRDAAQTALLSGKGDFHQAMDFQALSRVLGEPEEALAMYDRLGEMGDAVKDARDALGRLVKEQFFEARRYKEYLDAIENPSTRMDRAIAGIKRSKGLFGRLTANRHDLLPHLREKLIEDAAKDYEALLATGRVQDADVLAIRLLKVESNGKAFTALIRHATRAGKRDAARALVQRAEAALPEEDLQMVREAAEEIGATP